MAGCIPCFIIPLLLFIFHRYIQPILLRFWNPWEKAGKQDGEKCKFNCDCSWNKNTSETDDSKKSGGPTSKDSLSEDGTKSIAVTSIDTDKKDL
ncbi:UPF0729 protein GD16342 [Euwallacea fornicatus]|uniref:UPF0729 protein GD16342 n=1 Tax=Euwallacea fornicatus TaxID=995702 RepID=UPI00338FC94D